MARQERQSGSKSMLIQGQVITQLKARSVVILAEREITRVENAMLAGRSCSKKQILGITVCLRSVLTNFHRFFC